MGYGGGAEYGTGDRVQPKSILNRTCYFSMERVAVLTLRAGKHGAFTEIRQRQVNLKKTGP